MSENESEFGKGLTYCIGLFLAHEHMLSHLKTDPSHSSLWPETWFNGASDHLYDLDTEMILDDELQAEIDAWAKKVLHWGHGFSPPTATEADVIWALQQARDFLRRIDETVIGVETIKGNYE